MVCIIVLDSTFSRLVTIKSVLLKKLLPISVVVLIKRHVLNIFRFSTYLVILLLSAKVSVIKSIRHIWLLICQIYVIWTISSLMIRRENKLGRVMINLRLKIKQNSCRSWKLKRKKRLKLQKRRGRKLVPRCIFLMDMKNKLSRLMTLKKSRKCEDLKKKSITSVTKSKNLLMPCRKKLKRKMKANSKTSK